MGFAMLWIFLTHSLSLKLGFNPSGILGLLFGYGYLGVDVFLFLSAYGLSFSLEKNDVISFYKRRIQRIIPIWFIVLLMVHLAGIVISSKMPELDFKYPKSLDDLFFWYSGLGFWFDKCCYEWYVPSILALYFVSPFIFKMNTKGLIVVITCIYSFLYIYEIPANFQYLSIMLQRAPIFLLGYLYYKMEKNNDLIIFYIGSMCVAVLILFFPHESAILNFSFLCPLFCLLLSCPLTVKLVSTPFAELGSISLEFYLIHLYKRPQFLFSLFTSNPTIQVVAAFVLCCIGAYVLHQIALRISALSKA